MSVFSSAFESIFKTKNLEKYLCFSERFETLYYELIKKNEQTNITAITSVNDVINKHFADCVCIEKYIPKNSEVIDIGCGGGFPTLPLAIVRPDIKITAVDSVAKKLDFVSEMSEKLGLRVTTVSKRAEELGREAEYREKFDICVSRAVAELNLLSELCVPLVKLHGGFIAMKGKNGHSELSECENGLKKLGIGKTLCEDFCLSDGSERSIFYFEKEFSTPENYPRKYNRMKREPLR